MITLCSFLSRLVDWVTLNTIGRLPVFIDAELHMCRKCFKTAPKKYIDNWPCEHRCDLVSFGKCRQCGSLKTCAPVEIDPVTREFTSVCELQRRIITTHEKFVKAAIRKETSKDGR